MSTTIELAQALIRQPSVTPEDGNCQKIIANHLSALGFKNTQLPFGDVSNLWSVTEGDGPLFVFAGHTDVVPVGTLAHWTHPPFNADIVNGHIFGRGAADMKSSIAAMMVAVERLITNQQIKGRIGFLITSDEEGPAKDGTVKVIDYLTENGTTIDWCIVGEPTSTEKLGDIIKNGRRGSMNGLLTVHGKQGHVAYPHLANNPIHLVADTLNDLNNASWDKGNEFFPPTTFQISNINAGTGADNVIPADLTMRFNFRFSTEVTTDQLQQRVIKILDKNNLDYDLTWNVSGQPFITDRGKLVEATLQSINQVCGYEAQLSTTGGTSDGRFIAPTGAEVLELGPINATIHQVDECVSCDDLENLTDIYTDILRRLLT